jgi:hypothetical protein
MFDEMCTRYIVSWIMLRVMLRWPLSSRTYLACLAGDDLAMDGTQVR